MKETWQRHKKYISVVGGGGIAAIAILFAFAVPAFRSASHCHDEADGIADKVKLKRASPEYHDEADIAAIGQENLTLHALVEQTARDVSFHSSGDFRLPPEEKDPYAGFTALKDGAMKKLVDLASRSGVGFPETFGFEQALEAGKTVSADDVPAFLERLELIDMASRLAIQCGVKRVESFSQGDPVERELGPESKGDAFLSRNLLRITVGGPFESVMKVLHGLQQRGRYASPLAVSFDKTEPETDYVKASFTLAAVHVDLAAKKESEEGEEKPTGRTAPKKPPKGGWGR